MNGAVLQQVFVVDFIVQSQMCDDCHRVEAKDYWKAVVQVRQKVNSSLIWFDFFNDQKKGVKLDRSRKVEISVELFT